MKWVAALAAVVMLVMGGGCGQQPEGKKKEKEAAQEGPVIGGFSVHTRTLTPKTTEETRVIVIGKGKSSLALYIYDRDGNCVAHDDKGTPYTKDDLAVSWFPQKKETYTMELVNVGPIENPFHLVVR